MEAKIKADSLKSFILTIDDGPPENDQNDQFVKDVLKILKKENVLAEFFMVGNCIETHQDIVREIFNEGHGVHNHTWSHSDLTTLSEENIEQEVSKTQKIIKQVIGSTSKFFRAPWGKTNDIVDKVLLKHELTNVGWEVDCGGYGENKETFLDIGKTTEKLHLFERQGRFRNIVLIVHLYPSLMENLQYLLRLLKNKGYKSTRLK
jgi:peptidoglycan/xylan/chitin deacetylase (PgdA/CDA1 family)